MTIQIPALAELEELGIALAVSQKFLRVQRDMIHYVARANVAIRMVKLHGYVERVGKSRCTREGNNVAAVDERARVRDGR